MPNIGLMGGSFNPVHCGHINLARAALDSGLVDSVLFLPTGNPPHKREGLADKLCRLRMVELAIEDEPGMAVSREEIDRSGVIYTVDTLANLAKSMPGCRFTYLIGADTLRALGTWRRIEDVIARCGFLVMMRPGEQEAQIRQLAQAWTARGAKIGFLAARKMDISSTDVRARVAQGQSVAHLVPPKVAAYIRGNALYGARDTGVDESETRENDV